MNYVPFIAIVLCCLAIFAGWSMNQSGKDSEEVSLYFLISTVGGTFWFLLNQTWPAWTKVAYAILVATCFVCALRFTKTRAVTRPVSKSKAKTSEEGNLHNIPGYGSDANAV